MESRLKKSLNAGGRESRASEDNSRLPPEEKFMTAQERRRMWSEEWTQSALPKVPTVPGWHTCWLSTTNSYDSIDKRMRLGYVPVKSEEMPGFENFRVKAGEHTGFVACNEMLLFKIPMDMYQDVMTQVHHEMPNDEAEKIKVQVEQLQGGQDSSGRNLAEVEGDGLKQLSRRNVPDPVFHG
jgi:hypothetical protein